MNKEDSSQENHRLADWTARQAAPDPTPIEELWRDAKPAETQMSQYEPPIPCQAWTAASGFGEDAPLAAFRAERPMARHDRTLAHHDDNGKAVVVEDEVLTG